MPLMTLLVRDTCQLAMFILNNIVVLLTLNLLTVVMNFFFSLNHRNTFP